MAQEKASTLTAVPKAMPDTTGVRYLSIRERDNLNQQLQLNAAVAGATSDSYANATDGGSPVLPPGFNYNKAKLNEQAKNTMRVLKEQSPKPLSAAERDNVASRVAELEAEFSKNQILETFAEIRVTKRAHPDWVTASKKAAMRPKWDARIREWQNCKRLLEPENDEADNLDQLRRAKD